VTLRMMWPLWVTLLVFGPLLALTLIWAIKGQGRRRRDWLRRSGMIAALAVIALTPAIPDTRGVEVTSNAELYFVVDRTGSMAAEDYNGSEPRLEGVRADMVALTEEMAGSRYTIIGFDSQATQQLPMTTDARAVRSWAQTLTQEITAYSSGSAIDRPLDALHQSLVNAQERNPENVRLVFFLSDGENTEGSGSSGEIGSFAELAPLVDGGAVLGYGSPDGGPMRSYDGTDASGPGSQAPYIQDPETGQDAISMIDENSLRTVAAELGIDYSHRSAPDDGVADLVSDIDLQEIAADGRREQQVYTDVYWPAAAALALLLAWEAWDLTREMPKSRRQNAGAQRDRRRSTAATRTPVPAGRGNRS